MSPAIKVENLSKSYLVGHNSARAEGYTALRDVLARNARNLARKTRDMLTGRQIVQGDEVEEFWALKDVSFEIQPGDRVGIIGRNGAGKSTLLKILSRITEPTYGRVTINGRVASLLEVGTGFHPELTGRENVFLNGAILGMTRKEIQNKFDEIVTFAEVEKFLDTPVKRYSSGMYVRLAFAVAAHLEPEILIVDEVLAVGDAQFQKKCLGKMEEVGKEGRTVLFVSHNMAAIKTLCQQAIMLSHGCVKNHGETGMVVNDYLEVNLSSRLGCAGKDIIDGELQGVINKIDPSFVIHEVRLVGTNKVSKCAFESSEEIGILIVVESMTLIKGLRVVVSISSGEDVRLMTMQNLDDTQVAESFSEVYPGKYEYMVRVPPNTFGKNSYSVSVDVIFPRNEHHVLKDILSFNVDFNGYNNISYAAFETSLIRPSYPWSVCRL